MSCGRITSRSVRQARILFQRGRNFNASMATSAVTAQKLLTMDNLNPNVIKVEYAVRGPIVEKAVNIERELKQGVEKPFKNVVKANIGDCHAMQQKPITFIRQVISACSSPELIDLGVFPSDVNERAKAILKGCGGSIGSYSPSQGVGYILDRVAEYIEKRDGYPADPSSIFLTNGASTAVKLVLEMFVSPDELTGIMIPIPQYPLYSASVAEFGCHQISYYLDEDSGWSLDIKELKRALDASRPHCRPRVLCCISPGNPTGQVLSYDNIRQIIEFCMEENLFLMADEVYQDNIYEDGDQFHSFKKVLRDMGPKGDGFEMASFHSTSKGFMGECGLRGGYVEVIGLDGDVLHQMKKLQSAQLGSNVIGQIVLECVVNPPKQGEPSYELYMKEKNEVLDSLKARAKLVYDVLNTIEGVKVNKVAGAMYAFPQIQLPEKAIEKAKSLGQAPDFMYCMELLEETGLCVVPGSGFGQRDGTHHFRMTILPPMDQLVSFLDRFKTFHQNFLTKYK